MSQVSPPRIAFDTSALNAIAKARAFSEHHIKALQCGFDVWLTAMSVDELVATTDADAREMLIACCQRLLASGRCVWPPHEIISLLVSAHARNSGSFDWRQIDIRARIYERAIIDRNFTDELCVQQLNHQRQAEREFMKYWEVLRPTLDGVLAKNPAARPTTYRQAVEIAQSAKPKLLWGIGRELYHRASGKAPCDAAIATFLDVCPPFRAVCYGLFGSWYDVALAPVVYRKLAGRNDQMMSVYLPYCSRFVTQDRKQLERLRDIAAEAKLECEVLSCKDFSAGFEVVA